MFVASDLHGLGFNLPWKKNGDFGRIHEWATGGLNGESVNTEDRHNRSLQRGVAGSVAER